MVKYKVTSLLLIADGQALLSAIFPNYNGQQAWFEQSEIIVVFDTEQTPNNLGPLVKIELLQN